MSGEGGAGGCARGGLVPSFRVLASGSAGNCSVLVAPTRRGSRLNRRVVLIDCGLSPERTARELRSAGIELWEVDDIVLTHLDHDHYHEGWGRPSEVRATLRVHRRHLGRAERRGALFRRAVPFEGPFGLGPMVRVTPGLFEHDQLGVAAFRFEVSMPGAGEGEASAGEAGEGEASAVATLGFVTDVGRVSEGLIGLLRGVGVLAIESNYCPALQAASARPAFLKRRITGGSGHLSNEEAWRATHAIGPEHHAVLLHVSRQCNEPGLIAAMHAGSPWGVTIAEQERATGWVELRPGRAGVGAGEAAGVGEVGGGQLSLFEPPGAGAGRAG